MDNERLILDVAKQQEAERRLMLLGDLISQQYEYEAISERSIATLVPIRILKAWQTAYQQDGLGGLLPTEWEELPEKLQRLALNRYKQLGQIADAEVVPHTEIAEIADTMSSSFRTAERWLKRYRVGGLWGLTPGYDPFRPKDVQINLSPRDIGTFNNATFKLVYERYEKLGGLTKMARTSDKEVKLRAEEVGVSPRTMWNWLSTFRKYGISGLAPMKRADAGKRHNLSERMVQIIEGIRLTNLDWKTRAVYELACQKASQLGENEPSQWQVRDICNKLPKAVKLVADNRQNEFRNKYSITYRIKFEGVVYQIDHTLIDVLVRDLRNRRYRRKSGGVRMWLTAVMDSKSRVLVAAKFAYDQPNRHTVATVIRESLLSKPGGMPNEIWVDNGKDLVSNHVRQLTRELKIKLHICSPNQPQHRGIGERFFGTLNTRLWSSLPGYVGSNTKDRNPTAKAVLLPDQLVERFWSFIERYHNEKHSTTGLTPLEYWREHCFAFPLEDERRLDVLLLEPDQRKVIKSGIKYRGKQYWHTELACAVGENVLVRADTSFGPPDEIEVFHDGSWLCTAFSTDSERGSSVIRDEVAFAKKNQHQAIRRRIDTSQAALEEAEKEIADSERTNQAFQQGSLELGNKAKTARRSQQHTRQTKRVSKRRKKTTLEDVAKMDL